MSPDNEKGRPGQGRPLEEKQPGDGADAIVRDPADTWATIRDGWAQAGDSMPRAGSVAWRLLDVDDPVRAAAIAVAEADAEAGLRHHGPSWARAMAGVAT